MMQNDSTGNLGAMWADCYHLNLLHSGFFLGLEDKSSPLKQEFILLQRYVKQYGVLYIRFV